MLGSDLGVRPALPLVLLLAWACSSGNPGSEGEGTEAAAPVEADTITVSRTSAEIDVTPIESFNSRRIAFPDRPLTASGPGGALAVVTWQGPELRIYEADGSLRATAMVEGVRPGQWGMPSALAWARDTIVVLSELGPGGAIELFSPGAEALDRTPTGATLGVVRPEIGAASSGWLAGGVSTSDNPVAVIRRMPVGGGEYQEIASWPAPWEREFGVRNARGRLHEFPGIEAAEESFATDPTGGFLAVSGGDYIVRKHNSAGALARLLEVESERVPLTDSLKAEIQERRLADEPPEYVELVSPVLDTASTPEYRPVVGSLLVGDDGSFVVERRDLDQQPGEAGDPVHLDLFSADDEHRGMISLPAGVRPVEYTGERVFGLVRDSTVTGDAGDSSRPGYRLEAFQVAGGNLSVRSEQEQ